METLKEKQQDQIKNKKMVKQGEGLRQYYMQHIHDLQLQIRQKTHNLNRLEAQRNDLNSKGNRNDSLQLSLPATYFCRASIFSIYFAFGDFLIF